MKLGFVSAILPELDLEQVFRIAGRLGYDCVEVMCWPVGKAERRYAGVTHIDVEALDDAAVARIKDLVKQTGVEISGLGYYPNALSPDATESANCVAHIRKVMDGAARLGLGHVNTFVGRDFTKSVDDNWPRFVATWRPLLDHAQTLKLKVGIENCPMLFSKDEWPGGKNLAISPAIWRRMFQDLPYEGFGLNYDPSHMIWQQMCYLEPIREFAKKLFHIHAKDVRLDRHKLNQVGILANPSEYHTPKLPGMGDVHWGSFFGALTDSGFNGSVCVEVEDRAFEGSLESRIASLRQSLTFLRNYVPKRGEHS